MTMAVMTTTIMVMAAMMILIVMMVVPKTAGKASVLRFGSVQFLD